jgi:hypothetical protein
MKTQFRLIPRNKTGFRPRSKKPKTRNSVQIQIYTKRKIQNKNTHNITTIQKMLMEQQYNNQYFCIGLYQELIG